MSQENVDATRRFTDAAVRGDYGAAAAECSPDVEIDDTDIPESTGRDSVAAWLARWDEAWVSWRLEDLEVRPIGEDRTVSLFKMIVTGKESGIELARHDAVLADFRGGRIVRIGYYNDQSQALRAVGLSPQAMSQENVERVRVVTEDLISGKGEFDTEGMLTKLPDEEFLAPDVEWDASEVPVLDISGVYRGVEAVRQYWREWFAAWEILHYEFRLLDAGDRVVALFDHQRMRGRSTGIEVPVVKYAAVMTIRDGLLVHWKLYMNQAEALEAVGLSEKDAHG